MPEQNIVDVSWDLEKFDIQTQAVIKNMEAVRDLGKQMGDTVIKPGSIGGFSELKAQSDALNQLIIQQEKAAAAAKLHSDQLQAQRDAFNKLSEAEKQAVLANQLHEKQLKTLADAQARGKTLTTETGIEIAKVNLQNQLSAKANKETAQSVLGLVNDYGLLKKEYNEAASAAKNLQTIALKSGGTDDKTAADTATAKAKALHDSLLQIETGVGQSQRNVGNYTGALKVLENALGEAKQKLDAMSQSERENTTVGQQLQKEVSLLSTLAGQQDKGFVSLRREVMNATQALATMAESGLSQTSAFKELQTEVSNARRGLVEFNEQQKLLSAESPKIAALTAVAKGLGAAYAIGAGGAALFANGNEKVEKELNKLVAVMTLLQGLTELNRTLQERTAIATALSGVKTGILNGLLIIKNFILKGSTAAQIENTAVTEAGTVATEANSVATKVATGAAIGFRAALIATGIGALLLLLSSAAQGMSFFSSKTKDAKKAIDDLTAAIDKNNISLEDTKTNIDRQGDLLLEKMKQRGDDQKKINDQEVANMREKEVQVYNSYTRQKAALDKFDKETEAGRKRLASVGLDPSEFEKSRADLSAKLREDTEKKFRDADEIRARADQKAAENLTAQLTEKKKKADKVVNDSTKEAMDLEFELYRIAQTRKLKLLDEEVNDTKNSFSKRIEFADEYRLASIDLANRTAQHEIEADKTKLLELEANYKKAKGTERNNIAVDIENEKKLIIVATAKKNDELLSIEDKFQKEQTQIVKDEQARQLKVYEDAAKAVANVRTEQGGAIEAIRATEKAANDKLLHDKAITQKQYDDAEKKSINDNLILSLQADLRKEESLRALAVLQHQSTVDIDNAITKTKANIVSANNQPGDKKDFPSVHDSEIEIAKELQATIVSLVDIGYQKEIDAIQKIIDLNNKRKDEETAAIGASTLSNQEKAAQLIILDASVAASNHKLAVEQNQIKVKQAKFDRDAAILGIIENAAIAEFKLPAESGIPGIAAGIAIGVAAAAQIALILARPLPTMPAYAKGTDNHPGGPALVGEAGSELVSPKGGRPFMTSRPMLLNDLPAGSKVFPADIMAAANASVSMSMNQRYGVSTTGERPMSDRALIDAMYDVGRMTTQAMKKQRAPNVIVNVSTSWAAYITKTVRE